jgi:hypothetical protein
VSTTIHGWAAIEDPGDPRLELFQIPGVPGRKMRLRRDIGGYLVAFAADYHREIAPLNVGTFDDWSWSPMRKGRASSATSDHCAGVAIDLNATKEGSQGAASLTWWANPIRRAKLARLRKRYPLLEWGGDYQHFRDAMHWTFRHGVKAMQVRRAMARAGITDQGRTRTTAGKAAR